MSTNGPSDPNDLDARIVDEPQDRLTELCAEMISALDRPENADVKAIVFLSDDERGGIAMQGYDDTSEGLADLFVHVKAIFQSMGTDLDFIGVPQVPDSPEGLDGI